MSDRVAHLYPRLEKLAHAVQKVGHPYSRVTSLFKQLPEKQVLLDRIIM